MYQTKRLAFVTCKEEGLFYDDKIAADTLSNFGFSVESVSWDAMDVEWKSYDVIILRSPWDYHLRYEAFDSWLRRVEGTGVPFFNQHDVIHWNMHKTYLRELEKHGINIPKTHFINKRSSNFPDLESIMQSSGLTAVVIKPSISGNGYKTVLVKSTADMIHGQGHLESLLKERDAMVQEFVPEVFSRGEISLVYFNRVYSHAITKELQSGDFRVDRDGPTVAHEPSDAAKAATQAVLDQVPGALLYARVDVVERDSGEIVLMELEVIEPELYFAKHSEASDKFAKALCELMPSKTKSA